MIISLLTFLLFYYIIWEILQRFYRCLAGRSDDEVIRSLHNVTISDFAGGGSDYEKIL